MRLEGFWSEVMTGPVNKLARIVDNLSKLPVGLDMAAMSFAVGKLVKFAGTSGVEFVELTESKVHVRIRNRKKVQNHIGSLHAAAMALLAETATGIVVGMNVPDDRIPVIKTMKVDYLKRARGDMEAVATLTSDDIKHIRSTEKGDITVPVQVTDEEGKEPISCEMIWAWVPKRR